MHSWSAFTMRILDWYSLLNEDNLLPDMQLNRRSRFSRDTKSDTEGSWVILGNTETNVDLSRALHSTVMSLFSTDAV